LSRVIVAGCIFDAASYMSGIRYRDIGEHADDGQTKIHVVEENVPFVFEFERALDYYCVAF